jgi:hypothetical protein
MIEPAKNVSPVYPTAAFEPLENFHGKCAFLLFLNNSQLNFDA